MTEPMITDIISRLAAYITAEILHQPQRQIGEAEALISSGLIDSFHLIDLSLFVERQFGVRIDDAELNAATFDTLAQLAALIQQRRVDDDPRPPPHASLAEVPTARCGTAPSDSRTL